MLKRIYNYIVILAASITVMVSCSKDSDELKSFTSQIDAKNSSLESAASNMFIQYSSDGGATYSFYPVFKMGQTYKARLVNRDPDNGDREVTVANCYDVDWSGSNPEPTGDLASGIADFTFGESNIIKAKVSDHYSPFNPSSWTGDWGGDEVGACCGGTDENTIRQDASNPNKFIMDNFWADGVDAYIIFTPSTSLADQVVTLPQQTTSEGGVASGTGTYEQCYGTFTINTTYKIGGKTYNWQYNFHR
jgi:hypothetical protein